MNIKSHTTVKQFITAVICLILAFPYNGYSQKSKTGAPATLEKYNVSWDTPGPSSLESMPLGNGDIGLNVWVETNGDLAFYISKTDAWSEDFSGSYGLLKVGGVHLKLSPSPLTPGSKFLQVLKLRQGEIQIKEGVPGKSATIRVWVDANNPVIRTEVTSDRPLTAKLTLNNWRTKPRGRISADTVLSNQKNSIAWYHRDGPRGIEKLINHTFGGIIKGRGMTNVSDTVLQSASPSTTQLISIYPLTADTPTAAEWLAQLNRQAAHINALNLEQTRLKHQQWWSNFWNRSWIYLDGEQAAEDVTRGYILQRFITACGGRGAYPIKFNGSIFTTDNLNMKSSPDAKTTSVVNADYRTWGGSYWFQNTRAMYWPLLMEGDFDMMKPLFKMYTDILHTNIPQTKKLYGHDGAYITEVNTIWGGLQYVGPETREGYHNHYYLPVLELSMMMLDYYEYTGDKQFARDTLIPMASAGLTFYDQHFKRDDKGKILLDPVNAIEMFWKAHDPAPDIAGLQAVAKRMSELPGDLVAPEQRQNWKRILDETPELPTGTDPKSNNQVLLPYTGPQTMKGRNTENPELYSIYPFRIYGLGKPDLQLAINTFNARKMRAKGCWVQDPIQAAMLGLTDVAKDYTHFALTMKDPDLKFPAFWAPRNDYEPDQDNGGNGENGLQEMLMQVDGKKILLLPACPKEWSGEFKLNAPYKTTVQGKIVNGKLTDLVVSPASRKADVMDMSVKR